MNKDDITIAARKYSEEHFDLGLESKEPLWSTDDVIKFTAKLLGAAEEKNPVRISAIMQRSNMQDVFNDGQQDLDSSPKVHTAIVITIRKNHAGHVGECHYNVLEGIKISDVGKALLEAIADGGEALNEL